MNTRGGENPARRSLDFVLELVVLECPVALENNAVDDRVLDHTHQQVIAIPVNRHVGKQVGGKQRFQRQVYAFRIERIARLHKQVGLNGPCLDPLVPLHED